MYKSKSFTLKRREKPAKRTFIGQSSYVYARARALHLQNYKTIRRIQPTFPAFLSLSLVLRKHITCIHGANGYSAMQQERPKLIASDDSPNTERPRYFFTRFSYTYKHYARPQIVGFSIQFPHRIYEKQPAIIPVYTYIAINSRLGSKVKTML